MIDEVVTRAKYSRCMRRFWLTLLLALALAAGGLASAGAAYACAPKTPPAAHDCCPEQGAPPSDPAGDDGGMDCPYMQLCRAAPVLASEPAPATPVLRRTSMLAPPRLSDPFASASPDGLFRPPRAL